MEFVKIQDDIIDKSRRNIVNNNHKPKRRGRPENHRGKDNENNAI